MGGVGEHLLDDSFSIIDGPALKNQPNTWNSIWPVNGIQTWGEPGDDDPSTPPLANWNYHIEPDLIDGTVRFKVSTEPLNIKSYGTVRLASTDVNDPPLIDPKYMQSQADIDHNIQAVRKALAIFDTEAIKSITEGDRIDLPGNPSDAEIEAWIRERWGNTDFHPVGTCRMGTDPVNGDVVDPYLKVHGVENLRIMDASIFPSLTHGNPSQPSMLVGLRGAEMILNGH